MVCFWEPETSTKQLVDLLGCKDFPPPGAPSFPTQAVPVSQGGCTVVEGLDGPHKLAWQTLPKVSKAKYTSFQIYRNELQRQVHDAHDYIVGLMFLGVQACGKDVGLSSTTFNLPI